MEKKVLIIAAVFAALILVAPLTVAAPIPDAKYYGKVEVMVTTVESTEINFGSSELVDVLSSAEPPGFHLKEFKIVFEEGLPEGVTPVLYDQKIVSNGVVKALISRKGEIKLAPSTFNGTVKAKLISVFVKESWVELSSKVKIDLSQLAGSGLDNVTVRFTIDNYAPYAVRGLISPDGDDMLKMHAQESAGADAIKFDPKHVEFAVSSTGFGVYTVELAEGEEYSLPNAFIVAEGQYMNLTVLPGATKTVIVKKKSGWRALGAIVVLYSVNPGKLSSRVAVEGGLVDLAYSKGEEFEVEGASLMVPPLQMSYWIKAYLVYGDTIKITNNGVHEVNGIIVPINIKAAGTWTEKGLIVNVDKKTLRGSTNAYIVVQLPDAASINSIILPDGSTLKKIADGDLSLMGMARKVVISQHEALVQIKKGAEEADGQYIFEVEWKPITVKLTDADGNPISGAVVKAEGPVEASGVTDATGTARLKVYAPGVYHVTAVFKGAKVADATLGTLKGDAISVKCAVYSLQVTVTTKIGSPIEGAVVTISNKGGFTTSAETDSDGKVVFAQIPAGEYKVKAEYKGSNAEKSITVDSNAKVNVAMDIVLELPFIGPISVTELAAAGTAGVATALALAGRKHSKRDKGEIDKEEAEKSEELYDDSF